MKFEIKVGVSQSLKLNRKILQALHILQQTHMELNQTVQQALESNIMLEEATPAAEDETNNNNQEADGALEANDEQTLSENIPEQLPIDAAWEDVVGEATTRYGEQRFDAAGIYSREKTLHEYLQEQAQYLNLDDTGQLIAMAIIDAIDNHGYLSEPIDNLVGLIPEATIQQMEKVLTQLQGLDPPGVAARTPQECLRIQLLQLPQEQQQTSCFKDALHIIDNAIDLFTKNTVTGVASYFNWSVEQADKALALVRSLQPHPGSAYENSPTRYIVPEVFVRQEKGRWKIDLNQNHIPKLRINPKYMSYITRGGRSLDQSSLKTHLQEARWLLDNLRSRAEVVLEVSSCIVRHQENFLKFGEEAMRPLILEDIAKEVGIHVSTVSRATIGKYMHTPQGIYPFRFFFPSQIKTEFASGTSSTAVKALIRKLISVENSARPLSDGDISSALHQRGIRIARRTVAKYREAINIPARKDRRQT